MILVFIQNAWMPGSRKGNLPPSWPKVWRRLLENTRTGKNLRWLLGEDCYDKPSEIEFADTTDEVAFGRSSGKCKPRPDYIRSELDKFQPTAVVCCGQQAVMSVPRLWDGQVLGLPHPTARFPVKPVFEQGRLLLGRLPLPEGGRILLRAEKSGPATIIRIPKGGFR